MAKLGTKYYLRLYLFGVPKVNNQQKDKTKSNSFNKKF